MQIFLFYLIPNKHKKILKIFFPKSNKCRKNIFLKNIFYPNNYHKMRLWWVTALSFQSYIIFLDNIIYKLKLLLIVHHLHIITKICEWVLIILFHNYSNKLEIIIYNIIKHRIESRRFINFKIRQNMKFCVKNTY